MKKVLIFSRLTGSGAPQRRVDNLIQLFSGSSYKTHLVRFESSPFNSRISVNKYLDHISLGALDSMNLITKISRLLFPPKFAQRWLESIKPDIVVIYSTINCRTAKYIKKYCKSNGIKLLFDVVEFRKPNLSVSLRGLFAYTLHNYIINNRIIDKGDNVIVISKFLQHHFEKKGIKNIFYYPITFDVANTPHFDKKMYKDKVTFLYAGSPGGKRDLINQILLAFSMLEDRDKDKIRLFVCGIDRTGLIKEGVSKMTLAHIDQFTEIMGRINKEELYSLMKNINFSLLLKDETKIFSKAGFPTKMTESLSFRIPMITNFSGDISLYLKDGYNSLICPTSKAKDYVNTIKKAISIVEMNQHSILSTNAYNTAVEKLNTESYITSFNQFLEQLFDGDHLFE